MRHQPHACRVGLGWDGQVNFDVEMSQNLGLPSCWLSPVRMNGSRRSPFISVISLIVVTCSHCLQLLMARSCAFVNVSVSVSDMMVLSCSRRSTGPLMADDVIVTLVVCRNSFTVSIQGDVI